MKTFNEIMLTESEGSDQAKKLGLTHVSFGRYADKSGKIVAVIKDGKLYKIKGDHEDNKDGDHKKENISKNANIAKKVLENKKTDYIKNLHKKLNDDDNEELLYLLHDKGHVINQKEKLSSLNKVFKLYKDVSTEKKLYRGLYSKENKNFKEGQTITLDRYTSFSEDESVSKSFSENKIIMVANKSKGGFNYNKYISDYYNEIKKNDKNEFDDIDGEEMLRIAEKEKETIFNIGTNFKVSKIEEKNGYTYIHGDIE